MPIGACEFFKLSKQASGNKVSNDSNKTKIIIRFTSLMPPFFTHQRNYPFQ